MAIEQVGIVGCGLMGAGIAEVAIRSGYRDFIGIDTAYYIAEILHHELREPHHAPPPLLKQRAIAGLHGRKSGRGFYEYEAK